MSQSAKGALGKEGENISAKYFTSKGCAVLFRNVRQKFGELDLIVKDKAGCLIFVEVKTMRKGELGPEDQMSGAKIKKFQRIAEFFANSHPELIDEKRGWRIDVLALTKNEKDFEIKHYENIV